MANYDWDKRPDRERGSDWEERRWREARDDWREGDRNRRNPNEGEQHERWGSERWRPERSSEWNRGEHEDWRRNQSWSGENRGEAGRDREFPGRSDWGPQGRWGSYGNRSSDWGREPDWGRSGTEREWNRDRSREREGGRQGGEREWMQTYGGGGTYGGGLGMYPEQGRFTGRGPKNWHRSDERIREDVNERLTDHPDVDASEIEVQVKNGEVTLTGSVNDRHAKRIAEDIAERVSGVREVHNQLRVQAVAQTGTNVLNR